MKKSAEDIKIKIGTVSPEEEEMEIEVSGKYVLNGLPKDITLTSSELNRYFICTSSRKLLKK